MNKDQIQGRAEQAKGVVKEVTGKVIGNKELEIEGKIDEVLGLSGPFELQFGPASVLGG